MPLNIMTGAMSAKGFGFASNIQVKFSKQQYTTAGTYTFTVPPGNSKILVTASGGGGAGQTSYFNGGQWGQSNGAAGGNTTVTNGTFNITTNGGDGGNSSGNGGTVSISGAISTTLNQTGGAKSGTTGGNSYYASGTSQGGDFSKPATAGTSAGGGGGFQYDGPTNYGGSAGGTGIATVPVRGGQTINITVGAGAIGSNTDYTKGSNHGSYAGNGGVGYVSIEMA
jgi:hypothetical protein